MGVLRHHTGVAIRFNVERTGSLCARHAAITLGNGLRGDTPTRRRRVVVDYAPSDVVVGSWETAAGDARMPGQDHPAASEAIRAVGQDRMGYRYQ